VQGIICETASNIQLAWFMVKTRTVSDPLMFILDQSTHLWHMHLQYVTLFSILSRFRLPWPLSCCLNEPTPFIQTEDSLAYKNLVFGCICMIPNAGKIVDRSTRTTLITYSTWIRVNSLQST